MFEHQPIARKKKLTFPFEMFDFEHQSMERKKKTICRNSAIKFTDLQPQFNRNSGFDS